MCLHNVWLACFFCFHVGKDAWLYLKWRWGWWRGYFATNIASLSKSSIVASSQIVELQSSTLYNGSFNTKYSRSDVSFVRLSPILCHAILWANTGFLGWCLGICKTQTILLVSELLNSSTCRNTSLRFVHCFIKLYGKFSVVWICLSIIPEMAVK